MGYGRSRTLVGRETELHRLRAAAESARAGRPVVVVVEGEAGIGKTRLIREFTGSCLRDGEVLAVGHGVDLAGGAIPYGMALATAL
jgi:putative protein kinase ArgK-like GTPase of G3E family